MATQEDLDLLDAAIDSGAQVVRYSDGRQVVYRSLDDMLRTRDRLARRLAGAGAEKPIRLVRIYHDKGLL